MTAKSRRIDFSSNLENKLDRVYFSTLRAHDPSKYVVGNVHSVYLRGQFLFNAAVQSVKPVEESLNSFICESCVPAIGHKQFVLVLYKRLFEVAK